MAFVLDTNMYIGIERNDLKVIDQLSRLNVSERVSITALSYSELYDGLLKGKQKEFKSKLEKLDNINLLNTTKNSSRLFAEIKHKLEKEGKMIPLFDVLIASIVIDHNMTLITADEHFKRIPGLKTIILNP